MLSRKYKEEKKNNEKRQTNEQYSKKEDFSPCCNNKFETAENTCVIREEKVQQITIFHKASTTN